MISQQTINAAVQWLVAAAHPAQIVLFGSYARNEASEDSDLAFWVILPTLTNKRWEMVRLRQVLRPLQIPVDVLGAYRGKGHP